ncbi:hypothetical protein QBC42DRAFT_43012 [Cladorrhinum samala]|uniref:Uncharacterized protein n=1 Tax=Cladorrhinum samala TaxID=585594 RepID=A0AAV9I1J5_9PEZI|nr:hypothetical protein QBC42DRAFT_43012 [Cladorrhinum samala]
MAGFADGLEAAAGQDATPLSEQTPITVDSFLPPRIDGPRAWQRVAVAPVPRRGRQRKIWKRVGGLTLPNPQDGYARANLELSSRSKTARKRTRPVNHVPIYGDAKWDPRVDDLHDGKADLEQARESVSIEQEEAQATAIDVKAKHATFPEDRLNWVPRKRNNSRWPILSKSDMMRVVANKQSFDMPAAPEPVEIPMKVNEQQMMTRSPRRPTRRISLLPSEDSPRKLKMIPLSPAKEPAPVLSPTKRPPLSPVKVVESPLRTFRVNATPTKVVLESPKSSSPPQKSPMKSSPITSRHEKASPQPLGTPKSNSTRKTDYSVPLIFDSPTPDLPAEPQHETRRRLSLQAARRSERKSLGAVPLSRLEALRKSPNRRHSFTALENAKPAAPGEAKGRRNSVDCAVADFKMVNETIGNKKAVEVDVKTNLDIFAQWPQPATPETSRQGVDVDEGQEAQAVQATPTPNEAAATAPSMQEELLASSVSSPPAEEEELSVTKNAESVGPALDQAAASPVPSPQASAVDEADMVQTGLQQQSEEDMFIPYEPEGLSTIYEESYIESPAMARKQPAQEQVLSEQPTESSADKDGNPSTPRNTRPNPFTAFTPPGQTADQSHILLDAELQLSIRNSIRKEQSSRRVPEPSSPTFSSPILDDSSYISTGDVSGISFLEDLESEQDSAAGDEVSEVADHVATHKDVALPRDLPERELVEPDIDSANQPETKTPELDSSAESASPQAAVPSVCVEDNNNNELLSNQHSSPKDATPEPESSDSVLAADDLLNGPDALSQAGKLEPQTPATPAQAADTEGSLALTTPEAKENLVVDPLESDSPSFTPINGRQSPPISVHALAEEPEAASSSEEDDLDADEVIEQQVDDEGADISSDDDSSSGTDAPRPINDTMQLQAMHDDSETEMLRKFVTRVAADKNAKVAAAAAAAALSTQSSRHKRNSGSNGTVTSSTGSPIARSDSESQADRIPLGEKSPNSPSPHKKRKHEETNDDAAKDTDDSKDAAQNCTPAPVLKKRRKLGEPFSQPSESTALSTPDEDESFDGGPRRSTRARSARILRPSAPSANSIALSTLSQIPVRLPGMGAMDDSGMDGRKSIGRIRSEEKDIAMITKNNTRKNKGAAVPPPVVLQKQQVDSSWIKLESKRVVDSTKSEVEKAASKSKSVKWDEQLARYQEADAPFKGMSSTLLADVLTADANLDDEEDELAIPIITEVSPVEKKSKVVAAPAEPTRRSNRTRLQAPTPVKKAVAGPGSSAAAAAAAASTKPAVRPRVSNTETAGSLAARAKAAVPKNKPVASTAAAKPTITATGRLKRKADSSSEATPDEDEKTVSAVGAKREIKRVKRGGDSAAAAAAVAATTKTTASKPAQGKPDESSENVPLTSSRRTTTLAVKKMKAPAVSGAAAATKATKGASSRSKTTKETTAEAPARPSGPNSSRPSTTATSAAKKLGMGANGTPAPKRRGRPPAAASARA